MKKLVFAMSLAVVLTGCGSRASQVSTQVSKGIEDRTGHGLNPDSQSSAFAVPPGDKAGSVKQVEQAREDLTIAEHALKAAREKKERILRAPLEGDTSIAVMAPEDGMVQKVLAGTGQKVAGSAPLFEIASLKSIWVRVPLYAGDVGSIDRRRPAKVHNLGDSTRSPNLSARPAEAPPTANANASTVDIYYELPMSGVFKPGRNVTGSVAILARGPAAGTQVVITGAAELFGTEFGTGK